MTLDFLSLDLLWRNAIGVVPFVLLVAVICRCLPCRASTRHALWLIALLSLLAPPILSHLDFSGVWSSVRAAVAINTADPGESPVISQVPKPEAASPVHAAPLPVRESIKSSVGSGIAQGAATAIEPAAQAVECDSQPEPALALGCETSEGAGGGESISTCDVVAACDVNGDRNENEDVDAADCLPLSAPRSEPSPAARSVADAAAPGMSWIGEPPQEPVRQSQSRRVTGAERAKAPTMVPAGAAPSAASDMPKPVGSSEHQVSSSTALPAKPIMPAPAATTAGIPIEWRRWIGQLLTLRDAIAGLTPIPAAFWIGGTLALAIASLWRIMRFRRLLRAAEPAPAEIVEFVARCSAKIGLRRPPHTLMVRQRISPLVWCGRRRLLLLPAQLWADLDDAGRCAVLLHELAHLRRRDHWVCWVEMVVGSLYWWHPLVWWIRRRIRDEADLCCDAWVTSLLPAGRGAYARALLATRQYISEEPSIAVPTVGLGVTTSKAKRFARRLTMVMTERSTPKLSVMGTGLAMCMAAAAWLSTPLWACPPTECQPSSAAGIAVTRAAAPSKPRTSAPPAPAADATTYERYMGERTAAPMVATPSAAFGAFSDDGNSNARLERLEERLNRLTEQVERLISQPRGIGQAGAAMPGTASGGVTLAVPVAPGGSAGGLGGRSGMTVIAPVAPVQPMPRGSFRAMAAPSGGMAIVTTDGGQTISRVYHLPSGKLEALIELMRRQDVPVLISVQTDGIEVQGTAQQHEIFGAFIELINPTGKKTSMNSGSDPFARERSAKAAAELSAELAKVKASKDQFKSLNGQLKGEQMRALMEAARAQQGSVQGQVQRLNQQAEELRRKARDLQEKANAMQSRASEISDESAQAQLLAQAEQMEAQSEEVEALADAQEEQAESIQDQVEAAQDEIEAMQDQMNDPAAAAADAAAEAAEAAEAADIAPPLAPAPDAPPAPPAAPAAPRPAPSPGPAI